MPVNPVTIAHSLGILVYKSAAMEPDGEFLLYNNVPTIVFKPSGRIERDRFVIAHELGHYCLGHAPRRIDTFATILTNNDLDDQAASRFATELLMPPGVVKYAVRVSPLDSVRAISEYFQVPEQLMRTRLKELGYL